MNLNEKIIKRFYKYVNKTESCWIWIGGKQHKYGSIKIQGKSVRSHRLSYAIAYGDFDEKLNVLHKCDNPPCVNPDHLFLGTQKDNVIDMIAKDRRVISGSEKGEKQWMSKLTNQQVLQIRFLSGSSISGTYLAKKYNISESRISSIVNNKAWRHI